MRIKQNSRAFNLLLGLLAAVPPFGIDMILPALAATGASIGARPSEVGLTMSVYLLSMGIAPLIYGPASDRYGRKPVMIFGCTVLILASIGCAGAHSLPGLLTWRALQGAGAASTMTTAIAIIRDLFDGQAARMKMSYVVIAINVVPMIAPTAGAALLALSGWRAIYFVLAGMGCVVLLMVLLGFDESAKIDPANRLLPHIIARNYIRVLSHPLSLGYILVNAAAMGAIFAYVTGSSLFFVTIVGLRPDQYGLIFGATAVAVMGGAFLDGRLSTWGMPPGYSLGGGLALLALSAILLLGMTLAGWMPIPLVILLMASATFSFGLISPNATNGAMQPLPQIAGSVGAAAGFIQAISAAGSSALVAILFDGHSALSMTAVMVLFSVLALASYIRIVRPAERIALPA